MHYSSKLGPYARVTVIETLRSLIFLLRAYIRTGIPKRKFEQSAKIMKLLYATNFLFKAKKKAILFKEDNLKLISELFTPCQNEPQFNTKIACLSNLFEVPLKPLRKLVDEPENMKAIKLLEQFFWVTILIILLFITEALGKLFERGIRKTQDKRNRLFQKHLSFFGIRYICS